MSDKIHRRVAEVLGMRLENDESEMVEEQEQPLPIKEYPLVPVPESAEGVDNAELPALQSELIRMEHGQRQTELLLEKGITAVQQSLAELPLMPPQYKPRAVEAAAELFKAVAELSRFKIEVQIKLTELKMKQAAFMRNKTPSNPLGTGNTFVINREELIRAYQNKRSSDEPEEA